MEVEFDVKIDGNVLYDYMLQHTMTSAQGLLGTMVGALMIVAFFMNQGIIYLIAGVFIVLYLPVTLYVKAHAQAKANTIFYKPLHYRLTEEGIEASQDDTVNLLEWDKFLKATSTRSSVIVYTTKINACIFPKKAMGDKSAKVIEMISTHMPPDKVKIKGFFA